MKVIIRSLVLFSLTLFLTAAAQAAPRFYWQCDWNDCQFWASSEPGTAWYQWNFGDGTGTIGQVVTHSYDLPGSGEKSTTVTLTYQLTNGSTINVSCPVTWFETGPGGDPGPHFYSGVCQ